ncbi:hypothetical protein NL676_028970 [Syzygium grande]|nr:hypothetical protein NL676_028970 [Syzygium grande]
MPSASAANLSPLTRANTVSIRCCYTPTCSATLKTSAKMAHRSDSRAGSSSGPTHSESQATLGSRQHKEEVGQTSSGAAFPGGQRREAGRPLGGAVAIGVCLGHCGGGLTS